ncbi:MAG: hypothetical protein A2600_10155 [Candidatus Lambdaproteobacteria bacterium RIFOXYD1_FULL_56_27]|uniref:HEAT repeat domain-containing protein n=1 Tax=Candidatus Lambdaproteobacteria bacterium RIFOXYD2_FULL_56_26 TaxID=1817773 RepID=A0A1F6H1V1_9PROT|nr:MAG: hypothetical protein A2426_12305 [Candidatus Lambdaproteobacteria bacterium RIFOXYC1_FULL_56_13]OGH04345.1 MAG: hypothetical protein A2557_10885 [Candidatus Lambdaproteobacteria bacterium RIFOXYD2_FULL_56_26]OGH08680.1 MAG: hypothetical protein A2600_10155 [Candidatus Lambdaproteobacteria bacterium RIFOXYD1_FULL_56_27]
MLEQQHYQVIDQLSSGADPAARLRAAEQLAAFEASGEITEDDLLGLLQSEELAIRAHAILALSGKKSQKATAPLSRLFVESNDPILLQELLEAFCAYGDDRFAAVVLKRIKKPSRFKRAAMLLRNRLEELFDGQFILDQILLSALKYLQVSGFAKPGKEIKALLEHKDPMIRLNCLRLYDRINDLPQQKRLQELVTRDPHPLVREAAAILMEKLQP